MAIHSGAAVAISLDIQAGSEGPRHARLAPLHPNVHGGLFDSKCKSKHRVEF